MEKPLEFRSLPDRFPFQAECIHADGSYNNRGHAVDEMWE